MNFDAISKRLELHLQIHQQRKEEKNDIKKIETLLPLSLPSSPLYSDAFLGKPIFALHLTGYTQ